jgi:hypothetical protein
MLTLRGDSFYHPDSKPFEFHRTNPMFILVVCISSMLLFPSRGHSQENASNQMSKTDSVLSTLAELKLPQIFQPEPIIQAGRFQFEEMKQQKTFEEETLNKWLEMIEHTRVQMLRKQSERKEMEAHAVEQTGMPAMSSESVELLIRNCVVELQRIDWDVASEAVLASEPTDKKKNAAAEGRLRAHLAIVSGLEKQLELARKDMDRLQALSDRGTVSQQELNAKLAMVEDMKAKLIAANATTDAFRAEMDLEGTETNTASALRLKQLEARKKVIQAQLEKLTLHRRLMSDEEEKTAEINSFRQNFESISNSYMELEIKSTYTKSLLRLMREALKSVGVEIE